ncbi:Aminopeptidase YpdF (MP-, MA-, MS-, AP-, NP- specific) [Anaerovibrio sp. JC8]|uniref:M24 family metallopeptidase n=1 Tax=Anaerovibrio sp. JC8 TaxID=1240085 RepID=UPI000A09F72A|nr:Xaa-Pro peptidase family protein [Anaerovibrio sp. JC8]ORT98952.1 Aminopeptidase YpdF (MP-, MA-, MS-, AP-, NP- specific) [Anaerovibrio sp. JC8]
MIADRIKALRDYIKDRGLDGVLVSKLESLHYFSGFTGDDTMLVVSGDDAVIVTDFRYVEQAQLESPEYRIAKQETGLLLRVSEVIKELGINNVGFEGASLVFDWYGKLSELLGDNISMKSIELNSLRQIKDEEELQCIRKAVAISDRAFEDIITFIKPGISENEVAARLESVMRTLGSQRPAFTTIVASGKRGSLPHGTATEKLINAGEFVTMDYGAVYKGYHSDITRTICVGHADDRQRDVYDAVLQAQLLGLSRVGPGASGKSVDGEVRKYLHERGYGKYFGHGLGHSLGLEIHEAPTLSPRSTCEALQPNMLITVEPGVYIPDWGGVRIEDTVLVTDTSREALTSVSKDLIELDV